MNLPKLVISLPGIWLEDAADSSIAGGRSRVLGRNKWGVIEWDIVMCGGFWRASDTAFIGCLGSLPSWATAVAVDRAVQGPFWGTVASHSRPCHPAPLWDRSWWCLRRRLAVCGVVSFTFSVFFVAVVLHYSFADATSISLNMCYCTCANCSK